MARYHFPAAAALVANQGAGIAAAFTLIDVCGQRVVEKEAHSDLCTNCHIGIYTAGDDSRPRIHTIEVAAGA
eukprot:CAMPEP_0174759742 /NCGR_PEP_ID=MMETSP1094-20130205/108424_1 /TAXON_ID=156173 /ORGANISM="Chrysochromulina brevifilum, Strain UTEX LB 985" /LENGTH=71 /DNA_ID=CAMNT_0015965681 /DNA_START=582 /DNA_END=797 /DNA_ORIENTATION=+